MEIQAVTLNGSSMDYVYVNGRQVIAPESATTGEIWYLDFRAGRLTQTKPSRHPLGQFASDGFELFCVWDWNVILANFYNANRLNIFDIPQEYVERIPDGLTLVPWAGYWLEIWNGWDMPTPSSERVTLNIDTRSGAPQNGDFWLEVTNA